MAERTPDAVSQTANSIQTDFDFASSSINGLGFEDVFDPQDPTASAERVAAQFRETFDPTNNRLLLRLATRTGGDAGRELWQSEIRRSSFESAVNQLNAMFVYLQRFSSFLSKHHGIQCSSSERFEPGTFREVELLVPRSLKRGKEERRSSLDDKTIEFIEAIKEPVFKLMLDVIGEFEQEAKKALGPDPSLERIQLFRNFCSFIQPHLLKAPFPARAIVQPQGAGDFGIVNMMFQNPYRGQDLFGVMLNTFQLGGPTVQAHVNRIAALEDILKVELLRHKILGKEGKFSVLNEACGPSRELPSLIGHPLLDRCRIVMEDFNPNALADAREGIEEAIRGLIEDNPRDPRGEFFKKLLEDPERFSQIFDFKHAADARRHIMRYERNIDESEHDLVICAGLFDYMNDKLAHKLVKAYASQLKPGGLGVVTNVALENQSRVEAFEMCRTLLLGWDLILRSPAGMKNLLDGIEGIQPDKDHDAGSSIQGLFPVKGVPHVYAEREGLNLFLLFRKE